MKRIGLVCLGLALGAASTAYAQGLTMQMSNGWNFTFSGNINAFLYYEQSNSDGNTGTPGGITPASVGGVRAVSATRITTGLLPAFAVFDAKGKEGNTDLGVHFGFAPQVNLGTGEHDNFGRASGASIDMRQVYMTVGGDWGQLLVGRELGVFSRQNILTDQTLFGIGATGNGAPGSGTGTTLGRIGFGYIYPNFDAQITYSTKAGQPYQLSLGLFEAVSTGAFVNTYLPRVEGEFTYAQSGAKFWVGGTIQSTRLQASSPSGGSNPSLTAWGGDAGIRYEQSMFSVTGSGYYGKGIGTTLLGNAATDGGAVGNDDARKSYGFIGQVTVTPTGSKVTVAGSYGSSYLKASNTEQKTAATDFRTENTLISGGIYYQATKSLKVVGEFDYWWTKGKIGGATPAGQVSNKQWAPALGFMLFF